MHDSRNLDTGLTEKLLDPSVATRSVHQSPSDTSGDPTTRLSSETVDPVRQIGRYEIRGLLGRGGFGAVFLGWDPRLERDVAIKVPKEGSGWSERSVADFLREGQLAAKIHAASVVAVYDVGECDRYGVFLAMEYVRGESLAERMRRSPISVVEACRIVAIAAEAVHLAHRLGIVHRDLKPANILLTEKGEVKVTDFGLAIHENAQRNLKGEISGTLAYMSPEQLRGDSHLLDGRSDVWSLGVLLYRLLTDKPPFRSTTPVELLEEIAHGDPKPIGQIRDDIDPRLDRLCRRCLSREPSARPATARELSRELQSILHPMSGPRLRTATVLGTLLILGVTALGFFAWYYRSPPETPAAALAELRPDSSQLAVLPSRPASSPRNLLEVPPQPLVFNSDNVLNGYFIHPEHGHFSVQSDSLAMFSFGDDTLPKFELVVEGHLRDNSGSVGLFWGLHRDQADPKSQSKFASIQIVPLARENWFLLQFRTLEGTLPHHRTFGKSETIDSSPLRGQTFVQNPSGGQTFSIRISVRQGRPIAARVQANNVEFKANIDRIPWEDFANGQIGVLVANGQVVIQKFMLIP